MSVVCFSNLLPSSPSSSEPVPLPTFRGSRPTQVLGRLIGMGGSEIEIHGWFFFSDMHACFQTGYMTWLVVPTNIWYISFSLSEERVRKGAEKLNKMINAKQQGRLDGFFTVKGASSSAASSSSKAGAKRKVRSLSLFNISFRSDGPFPFHFGGKSVLSIRSDFIIEICIYISR